MQAECEGRAGSALVLDPLGREDVKDVLVRVRDDLGLFRAAETRVRHGEGQWKRQRKGSAAQPVLHTVKGSGNQRKGIENVKGKASKTSRKGIESIKERQ